MLIIFSVIFLRSMPEEFPLGIFLSNISANFLGEYSSGKIFEYSS